jgi:outer membrane lipoprotein-sorting protein
MKNIFSLLLIAFAISAAYAQQVSNAVADPEAGAMLEKAAARYKSLKGIDADFVLTTTRPKLKPDDPDSKYTNDDRESSI